MNLDFVFSCARFPGASVCSYPGYPHLRGLAFVLELLGVLKWNGLLTWLWEEVATDGLFLSDYDWVAVEQLLYVICSLGEKKKCTAMKLCLLDIFCVHISQTKTTAAGISKECSSTVKSGSAFRMDLVIQSSYMFWMWLSSDTETAHWEHSHWVKTVQNQMPRILIVVEKNIILGELL